MSDNFHFSRQQMSVGYQMKSRTHYYCPTPADKAIKQPLGERLQPGFDDCGVTVTAIKYCVQMQESFTNSELLKSFQDPLFWVWEAQMLTTSPELGHC